MPIVNRSSSQGRRIRDSSSATNALEPTNPASSIVSVSASGRPHNADLEPVMDGGHTRAKGIARRVLEALVRLAHARIREWGKSVCGSRGREKSA